MSIAKKLFRILVNYSFILLHCSQGYFGAVAQLQVIVDFYS